LPRHRGFAPNRVEFLGRCPDVPLRSFDQRIICLLVMDKNATIPISEMKRWTPPGMKNRFPFSSIDLFFYSLSFFFFFFYRLMMIVFQRILPPPTGKVFSVVFSYRLSFPQYSTLVEGNVSPPRRFRNRMGPSSRGHEDPSLLSPKE